MGWVGTWATTPAATDGFSFSGQTLRMIAHVSIGGTKLRVKFPMPMESKGLKLAPQQSLAALMPPRLILRPSAR